MITVCTNVPRSKEESLEEQEEYDKMYKGGNGLVNIYTLVMRVTLDAIISTT